MQNYTHKKLYIILTALVTMGILIFDAWFLNKKFDSIQNEVARVNSSSQSLLVLDQILLDAIDAETGVRGYLITKEEKFLEPYKLASASIWVNLEKFKTTIGDEELHKLSLAATERVLADFFSLLEDKILTVTDESLSLEGKLDQSKILMDSLRLHIGEMQANERRQLRGQRVELRDNRNEFVFALIVTTIISVAIIGFSFLQILRNTTKSHIEFEKQAKLGREKDLTAQISQIFNDTSVLGEIGDRLLVFFSKHFDIVAGRIIAEDNERLQVISTFGVSDKEARKSFQIGVEKENLIEAAIDRGDIWNIKDVPSSYWKVSSSMGESIPNSLLLIPIIHQEETLGVLELAHFGLFNEDEEKLFERLRPTITHGLQSAIHRNSIQILLAKSQQQAEELQASEEEMRVNNEELEQQAALLETHQKGLDEKNRELLEVQAQLEERAEQLEMSSQYKSDFLAKMSHELRTPLNGLLILSTLLTENKDGNLTEQQIDFAKSIKTAGNDLLALINDILDLAKIEAMKLTLRPESFYLKNLIASEENVFEVQAKDKNLNFRIEVEEKLKDLNLFTDRLRLEQILRNFLSNAIKFTSEGSVTFNVEHNQEQDLVRFSVKDTGIGIPQSKISTIFEAFEQSDGSISRRFGGTGLGLTISKELSKLLGGKIHVESIEGEGSVFSLEIPREFENSEGEYSKKLSSGSVVSIERGQGTEAKLEIDPKSAAASASEVERLLSEIPQGERSILIVEDDHVFRSLIAEAVVEYGFHPIEIGDGEVALHLLNEFAPDAILLDIKLPGISGLGLLELIKQIAHLRHIPVHMISAMDYQHRALRMGAMGYLTKPVTLDKVKAAMERIEGTLSKDVKHVLIIEDDETQNKAITELIGGEDIKVTSVHSAESGIAEIKKQGFDCIILDLTLPGVNGKELLNVLSSLDISLPPIIIYTGKDLSEEEEENLKRYSGSIIIKGARSPERLLDEVNLFLHRIETALPKDKLQLLTQLRSHEGIFEDKTILVVDDDIRNIFALTSALESKNINIRVARDGLEALQAIKEHEDIDLVLMDIMMPNMDGFEAMTKIRDSEDKRIKNLPVVALTAKAMKEDYEKCIESGASDYLPKPVNLNNLFTILKVWLTK